MKDKVLGGSRTAIFMYLAWVAAVLLVAHTSGFRADAVPTVNWDIIFMITPWGLVQNLVFGAHPYLHPVYDLAPPALTLSWSHSTWNWHYLYIFAQSNLLEALPLVFLWPRWRPVGRMLLTVSVVNSITHPVVFFGIMRLGSSHLSNILLAETFAVVAEAWIYRRLGLRHPWAASLFANLISWQVAPALTALIFLGDKFNFPSPN